jgi:hypothetical protein
MNWTETLKKEFSIKIDLIKEEADIGWFWAILIGYNFLEGFLKLLRDLASLFVQIFG